MTNLTHTTRPDEADQVCPVYVGVEVQEQDVDLMGHSVATQEDYVKTD
jgi:hypothetical protein